MVGTPGSRAAPDDVGNHVSETLGRSLRRVVARRRVRAGDVSVARVGAGVMLRLFAEAGVMDRPIALSLAHDLIAAATEGDESEAP